MGGGSNTEHETKNTVYVMCTTILLLLDLQEIDHINNTQRNTILLLNMLVFKLSGHAIIRPCTVPVYCKHNTN